MFCLLTYLLTYSTYCSGQTAFFGNDRQLVVSCLSMCYNEGVLGSPQTFIAGPI